MNISYLNFNEEIFLAPMVGYTDRIFRRLVKEQRCGLVSTEMLSAEAIIRANPKTMDLLSFSLFEKPIAVQIFGNNKKVMSVAAKICQDKGADIIDINFGCPVLKIKKLGAGVALMQHPKKIGEIVTAVKRAISIPLTIKIRAGFSPNNINFLDVSHIAEESGADAIIFHPRTGDHKFKGKALWNLIKELKTNISLPVIGNGDIKTPSDAIILKKKTYCDGVMIGRGALGNPWIFREILDHLEGKNYNPSPEDKRKTILKHFEMLLCEFGVEIGIKKFKFHIPWYFRNIPFSTKIRHSLINCPLDQKRFSDLLEECLSYGDL
jgi:tRNA-dihydrouridine synthase B